MGWDADGWRWGDLSENLPWGKKVASAFTMGRVPCLSMGKGELTRNTVIKEMAIYWEILQLYTNMYTNMKIKSLFEAQHSWSNMGQTIWGESAGRAGAVCGEVSIKAYGALPLFGSSLYTTLLLQRPTLVPVFPNQKKFKENFHF